MLRLLRLEINLLGLNREHYTLFGICSEQIPSRTPFSRKTRFDIKKRTAQLQMLAHEGHTPSHTASSASAAKLPSVNRNP